MDPARLRLVEELFHAAVEVADGEREAFLARRCAGDTELLGEVRALLAADAETAGGETAADPLAPLSSELVDRALGGFAAPPEDDVGKRIGAWRIESVLGVGGMGRVYLATRADGAFEMKAALKLLRRDRFDSDLPRRFEQERQALARLEHPHIARLVDGGATADGLPYLVMEHVDGEPIDAFCDRRRLPLAARLQLFERVCEAVQHAHANLLVHRDLKPSNILVDQGGRPRLLDFGIARLLADEPDPAVTQPEERRLTPRYASPEQIRGEPVGTASDVYALGIVLHELLAGASPYPGDTSSRYDLERAICEFDPIRPSLAVDRDGDAGARAIAAARSTTPRALKRALAGDLDNVVSKALQKEPGRRYESPSRLADDLRRHRLGLPVAARGDGFGYRFGKFVGRNRVASTIGLLLVAAVVVALALQFAAGRRDRSRLAVILRLADLQRARDLEVEAASLWPARPEAVPAFDDWLARAATLLARRPLHERARGELSGFGLADAERRWLDERVVDLLASLDRLAADDPFGDTLAGVAKRRDDAERLARASLVDARAAWDRVAPVIAAPQFGLLPLGPDPDSALQEFAHLASGEPPQRGADGRLVLGEGHGIVLVLIPGGEIRVGAPRAAGTSAFSGPEASDEESGPGNVVLEPFFLSKHEVTQAQWSRITGANPSGYPPGARFGAQTTTWSHPVEQVSWEEAVAALRRVDLVLPREAEWKHACLAGAATPWWTGDAAGTLAGAANLADRFARDNGGNPAWRYVEWLDDGATVHAPIGSYRQNAFGLHDMHGNVWEWCRDQVAGPGNRDRVARGGGFFNPPESLRASHRYFVPRSFKSHSLGVRAARELED